MARSAGSPASAFIARSSVTSTPWNPIRWRMIRWMINGREGRGLRRIVCRIDDVRGHHPGQIGIGGKWQQVGIEIVGLHDGQRQVAVDPRPSVTGGVFADRLNTGRQQSLGEGPA